MSSVMNTYARYDISFVKGEGSYLWDENGKKYLDFGSGISVTNLGHCNKAVSDAIAKQAQTLIHTSNLYNIPLQEELADLIVKHSFDGKVFFCNSGAEANEGALKIARKYGNKKYSGDKYKIVSMYNSFHGRTYATLSATGQHKIHDGFTPVAHFVDYVPLNDIIALERAFKFTDVAGVIVELYQGEGGVFPAEKEYIKQVRDLCDKYDALLIFDEVQTGYGRTGKMFAFEHFGVTPDIMTVAKGIANGLPMGAIVATDKACKYMGYGSHGTTFGGSPLACAAGIAVINEMTKDGFLDDVVKKGELLKSYISNNTKSCLPRGEGLLIGVATNHNTSDIINNCLEAGLLILPAANNMIRLYPALNATNAEIEEGAKIFVDVINKLDNK